MVALAIALPALVAGGDEATTPDAAAAPSDAPAGTSARLSPTPNTSGQPGDEPESSGSTDEPDEPDPEPTGFDDGPVAITPPRCGKVIDSRLIPGWNDGYVVASIVSYMRPGRECGDEENLNYAIRVLSVTRDGFPDPRFNRGQAMRWHVGHIQGGIQLSDARIAADGSLYVVTWFLDLGASGPLRAWRVSRSGELDMAHMRAQGGPVATSGGFPLTAEVDRAAAAILADGSVRACIPDQTGETGADLLGLTARGERDLTLGPEGVRKDVVAVPWCYGIIDDGQDRLLMTADNPFEGDGGLDPIVARLTQQGDLDSSFDGDGIAHRPHEGRMTLKGLAVADGRVFAQGQRWGTGTSDAIYIAAWEPDGALAADFGVGGLVRLSQDETGPMSIVDDDLLVGGANGELVDTSTGERSRLDGVRSNEVVYTALPSDGGAYIFLVKTPERVSLRRWVP